jgi:cytoskeleton-associated protein 5
MKSKNPQVKEGTLKFLGRCLASSTSPIQPTQVKSLAQTLATLLEDGFESARNEAATCLGTLMKMVGERPLNAIMDGLADVRKAKVKESYEKAVVKCKPPGTGPPKVAPVAKPTVKKSPVVTKSAAADEDETPLKNPVNQSPAKAPVCSTTFGFGKYTNQSHKAQKASSDRKHCFHDKENITACSFKNT